MDSITPSRRDGRAARIRVLAVDDLPAFRRTLRLLVRATHGLELVCERDSGERAVVALQECAPELVLMDVRMPGMGGVAATTAIKKLRPATVVVLISTAHPDELPAAASTSGADEIVWKSDLRPALLDALWLRHRPARRRASPTG
jgi:DNA-binding NarL/FixJ family response regulator